VLVVRVRGEQKSAQQHLSWAMLSWCSCRQSEINLAQSVDLAFLSHAHRRKGQLASHNAPANNGLGLLGSVHHSPTLQLSTQTRKEIIFKQSLLNARLAHRTYAECISCIYCFKRVGVASNALFAKLAFVAFPTHPLTRV
jgi:hypothetical protein